MTEYERGYNDALAYATKTLTDMLQSMNEKDSIKEEDRAIIEQLLNSETFRTSYQSANQEIIDSLKATH